MDIPCAISGLKNTKGAERKRSGISRSMSRSMTSMRRTSMSKSSAPVDVSGGRARRPRHRIFAHTELLGQAEPGRNQREAPRSAGRCTVGDSDGPRSNI